MNHALVDSARGRKVSRARNAPRGRFESGNAAEVRRQSDAPAEIAANVEERSTGGEDRDGPAARSTRRAREVVRIVRPPVNEIVGVVGKRELGCIGLPDENRTASTHARDGGRVGCGNMVGTAERRVSCPHVGRVESVLDGHGNAVKRSQPGTRGHRTVSLLRLGECALTTKMHDRIQSRIDGIDAVQARAYYLLGRNVLVADRGREACGRCR